MGELRENVNKRSESANRKYRAFKHFLKYQNNTTKGKPSEPIRKASVSSLMPPETNQNQPEEKTPGENPIAEA